MLDMKVWIFCEWIFRVSLFMDVYGLWTFYQNKMMMDLNKSFDLKWVQSSAVCYMEVDSEMQ